jgi:heme o synthase
VKTGTTLCAPEALPVSRPRWLDLLELTKPRITVMVLFTVAIGAMLASPAVPDLVLLFNTLIGTTLVAAGASALNQLLERDADARMRRTENRPLPAGRLQPWEVLTFGVGLSIVGLGWLAVTGRHPLTLAVAAFTLLSYVLIYTPLKRRTTLNTLIGAVPGALPPVIGWTSVTGMVEPPVSVLFLVLFLWQVPHFLAIAWMYKGDYARAGMRMLPVVDPDGAMTARQMLLYCAALVLVSLVPVMQLNAGWVYGAGAAALGLLFLYTAAKFAGAPSRDRARRVLHVSLVYLPALFGLMLLEAFVTGKI